MIYIEQFLFQGRPPGSSQPPGWHLILGEVQSSFGQERVVLSDPMTPAEAEALGYPLPAILADINTTAMAEVAALTARVAALEAQLAAAAPAEPPAE